MSEKKPALDDASIEKAYAAYVAALAAHRQARIGPPIVEVERPLCDDRAVVAGIVSGR